MTRDTAIIECVRLVCQAASIRRRHRSALAMCGAERQAHPELWRLPELNLVEWYARALAALDAIEATGGEP